jgi:hypothetical protein
VKIDFRIPRRSIRRGLLASLCLVAGVLGDASAAPQTPGFGLMIDDPATYEGQTICSPETKPGVAAFRDLVLRTYPDTGAGSVGRSCSVGGRSEHKEGRAWDWGVRKTVPAERAAAEDLLDWLLRTDRFANTRAIARRAGIMYLIWDRRIWFPSSGWQTYCVQRGDGCHAPDGGGLRHPHTDHIHFSFSWPGARGTTTFWHKDRSFVSSIDGHPNGPGYWLAGRNGGVRAYGSAGYYGSALTGHVMRPVVDMTVTPTGAGYWAVTSRGKVYSFGDASAQGGTQERNFTITRMASTPSGRGYWLLSKGGRVFGFGNATHYGDARREGLEFVGLAATDTGRGYRLLASDGSAFEFGDAEVLPDAATRNRTIVDGNGTGSDGYWLVSKRGRVFDFGSAGYYGGAQGATLDGYVSGIEASGSGAGYYLVTTKGKIFAFGDADKHARAPAPPSRRGPHPEAPMAGDLPREIRSPSRSCSHCFEH